MDRSHLIEKYQTMTRALERGARDGRKNYPSPDEMSLSDTELEIANLAQSDAHDLTERLGKENDDVRQYLREHEAKIENLEIKSIDDYANEAELKMLEVHRDIARLYEDYLDRDQDYRHFKTVNELTRDAKPAADMYLAVATIIFIIVTDGVVNAVFFKDVNAHALIGGFIFAMFLSLVNTAIGFILGVLPWRYLGHRNRLHLLWAGPLFCFLLAAIVFYNTWLAHYRDALAANPDAIYTEVAPHLLNVPSPYSIAFGVIGFCVAMYAAYKGIQIFDRYPGFGDSYKARKIARDAWEARLKTLHAEFAKLANTFVENARKASRAKAKTAEEATAAADKLITANQEFSSSLDSIEHAARGAMKTYRDANIQVRDLRRFPQPASFGTVWSLSRKEDSFDTKTLRSIRDAFSASALAARKEFDEISKRVPAVNRNLLSEERLLARLDAIKKEAESRQDYSVGLGKMRVRPS